MFMGLTSSYYHIWEAKRARQLGQGNINLIINALVRSQKYNERDNLLDLFFVVLLHDQSSLCRLFLLIKIVGFVLSFCDNFF